MSTRSTDKAAIAAETMEFVKAFDAWLRRASMTQAGESVPRLQLLYELHCNGPRKMADLADTLGVTPRAVTTLVDSLEGEELVKRRAHPTDRRITMIDITGDGSKVEQQFAALQASLVDLFADLDPADAAAMRRGFRAVLERMEQRAASPT